MPQLPRGALVPDQTALTPENVTLEGQYLSLIPLSEAHIDPLFLSVGQPTHFPLWTYMLEGPNPFPDGKVDFANSIQRKLNAKKDGLWTWCIALPDQVDQASIKPIGIDIEGRSKTLRTGLSSHSAQGHVAIWRLDLDHRTAEIGHVMLGDRVRGRREGTEV